MANKGVNNFSIFFFFLNEHFLFFALCCHTFFTVKHVIFCRRLEKSPQSPLFSPKLFHGRFWTLLRYNGALDRCGCYAFRFICGQCIFPTFSKTLFKCIGNLVGNNGFLNSYRGFHIFKALATSWRLTGMRRCRVLSDLRDRDKQLFFFSCHARVIGEVS